MFKSIDPESRLWVQVAGDAGGLDVRYAGFACGRFMLKGDALVGPLSRGDFQVPVLFEAMERFVMISWYKVNLKVLNGI